MKINPNFIAREIAGELVIVPIGDSSMPETGLISANEVGAFIWHQLENGKEIDAIVAAILDEFDVDEESARKDTEEFIDSLKTIGAVIE